MNRNFRIIILLLSFTLLFSINTSAFTLRGGHTNVVWESGLRVNMSFTITNNEDTQEFYLYPYATDDESMRNAVEDLFYFPEPVSIVEKNTDHTFTAELILPKEKPAPGQHRILIGIDRRPIGEEQETEIPSGITAKINLAYPVIINVPYLGKHIEASLQAAGDAVQEKPLKFHIKAESLSTDIINDARGVVDIYSEGVLIESASDLINNITPGSRFDFYPVINTTNMKLGEYMAKGTIFYDGLVADAGKIDSFSVGNISIDIINISESRLKQGVINRLDLRIKSNWNLPISNVFADIEIYKLDILVLKFRTESKDIGPQVEDSLPIYVDALGLEEGIYQMIATLNYDEKTTQKNFVVEVSNSLKEPAGYSSAQPAMMAIIVLLIIIIILINVFFMIYLKKFTKSNEKKFAETKKAQPEKTSFAVLQKNNNDAGNDSKSSNEKGSQKNNETEKLQ